MTKLRLALLTIASLLPALSGPGPAQAAATHLTNGTGGYHYMTSHNNNNPGHVWILVKAPTSSFDENPGPPWGDGGVSSGGRYHDNCSSDSVCSDGVPGTGGDFSMDIGRDADYGDAGTKAYLYLDYAGYGQLNSLTPPKLTDPSKPLTISAYVESEGDVCGSGDGLYRKYQIWVDYTDVNNQAKHVNVGWVVYMHLSNWNTAYPVGTTITWNASRPSGSGADIRYINGSLLGNIYYGSFPNPSCNSGGHVHVEFYSHHSYGRDYEWHSEGPDGYLEPTTHKHTAGVAYPDGVDYDNRRDVTTKGSTFIGLVGGDSTLFRMTDNPYESDH